MQVGFCRTWIVLRWVHELPYFPFIKVTCCRFHRLKASSSSKKLFLCELFCASIKQIIFGHVPMLWAVSSNYASSWFYTVQKRGQLNFPMATSLAFFLNFQGFFPKNLKLSMFLQEFWFRPNYAAKHSAFSILNSIDAVSGSARFRHPFNRDCRLKVLIKL